MNKIQNINIFSPDFWIQGSREISSGKNSYGMGRDYSWLQPVRGDGHVYSQSYSPSYSPLWEDADIRNRVLLRARPVVG